MNAHSRAIQIPVTKPKRARNLKFKKSKNIPVSKYVIDLRRIRILKKEALTSADPIAINDADLDIQLAQDGHSIENETQQEKVQELVYQAHPFKRFFSGNLHAALSGEYEDKVEEAFAALDLPDDTEDVVVRKPHKEIRVDVRMPTFTSRPRVKHALPFFLLCALALLPIFGLVQFSNIQDSRSQIEVYGQNGMKHLSSAMLAMQNQQYATASSDLEHAASNLGEIQNQLSQWSGAATLLSTTVPGVGSTFDSAEALIETGAHATRAAELFSESFEVMQGLTDDSLTNKLRMLEIYTNKIIPEVELALAASGDINPNTLPAEYQEYAELITTELPRFHAALAEWQELSGVLQVLLGSDEPQRYLVLFQNNTELRPTGGFIGSYAEMFIDDGEIKQMHIPSGGSYDLQGSLDTFVRAPEPLTLINARWEFQDANWFPDFSLSAEKLMDFYEASNQPSLDGVIAVNATFVADLLELLGSVEVDGYNKTLTSENFLIETQKAVEVEYDTEENTPKQFIADLSPILLDRATNLETPDLLELTQHIGRGFEEKHIQAFVTDAALMSELSDLGWTGELKETDGDYLMVVNTNIGGHKSDARIEQLAHLDVDVQADGRIINTLTIQKTHIGEEGEAFYGFNNVDYMRVYVPEGSTLLRAGGDFEKPETHLFESNDDGLENDADLLNATEVQGIDSESRTIITSESGKTVFGNWLQTKPGETTTVQYVYELPIRLDTRSNSVFAAVGSLFGANNHESYSLFIQKQSGVERHWNVQVNHPEALEPIWSSEDGLTQKGGMITTDSIDQYLAILFK